MLPHNNLVVRPILEVIQYLKSFSLVHCFAQNSKSRKALRQSMVTAWSQLVQHFIVFYFGVIWNCNLSVKFFFKCSPTFDDTTNCLIFQFNTAKVRFNSFLAPSLLPTISVWQIELYSLGLKLPWLFKPPQKNPALVPLSCLDPSVYT